MAVKLNKIDGLMVEKKPEPTYFPAVEGWNQCITYQGNKEITLSRERLATIIFDSGVMFLDRNDKDGRHYKLADIINSDLKNLIEVVK